LDITDGVGGGIADGAQTFLDGANLLKNKNQSHILTITPKLAMMFHGWKMPWEFEIRYTMPVWGKNANAGHTFTFLAKPFFKI
jgi:hypothetical protein